MNRNPQKIFLYITMQHKQIETLARFIPVAAAEHVASLISSKHIQLKISNGRLSKLGDFRPAHKGSSHRISVNGTLNVYAFLLVFLHEYAHLQIWEMFANKVSPHGKEWKEQFGVLIREYVDLGFFHPALDEALVEFSCNTKASGLGDAQLTRALGLFDKDIADFGQIFLEELPGQSLFMASNGRSFRKEERLRKRYRCLCLENNRRYLFHPMAKVVRIGNEM